MARYQFRRPLPIKLTSRLVLRQNDAATNSFAATKLQRKGQGPEDFRSPIGESSILYARSEGEDSESEDEEEPHSPTESGSPLLATAAPTSSTLASISQGGSGRSSRPSSRPASSVRGEPSSISSKLSTTTPSPAPLPSTQTPSILSSTLITTTTARPSTITTTAIVPTAKQPSTLVPVVSSSASRSIVGTPAQSDMAGDSEGPRRFSPQRDNLPPLMTRGGAIAATVLGFLGLLALIIGAVIFIKRRKRRHDVFHRRLPGDAFSPNNTGSLHAPETAHMDPNVSVFGRGAGTGAHLTRSTVQSNTLFGPASYLRPETVSTTRDKNFRIPAPQQTPNPFADPPLNKAYDVLAGRPRSTTLTDRGSWIKNPFRDPESERFDPFGELTAKARRERENARREAEEEVVQGYAAKERIGLAPDGLPMRKGSGVTVEGLGVLDRTGGGRFR